MKKFIFLLFSFILLFAAGYKDLCKNLPDEIGIYRATDKCNGMNIEINGFNSFRGGRDYEHNNKYFSLNIVTGTFAMQVFPMFMQSLKIETNKEFIKTTTINGYKAVVSYNKDDNSGNITILIKNDPKNPTILIMEYNNLDQNEALNIIKKLNFLK
jgi:hypothetical protein